MRGRVLAAPKNADHSRPTDDRLREALFNILIHAYGDPDTGALGLAAIARGAPFALFDHGAEACALLRENVQALGLAAIARISWRSATKLGLRIR